MEFRKLKSYALSPLKHFRNVKIDRDKRIDFLKKSIGSLELDIYIF